MLVAGDGPISRTALKELGLANAHVLVEDGKKWTGKTFYLSTPASMVKTLKDVADAVSACKKDIRLKVVNRDTDCKFYEDRGIERGSVELWSTSYAAVEEGECQIDDSTLVDLLAKKGAKPKPVEETIREMLSG
jgi:hypothetical protein